MTARLSQVALAIALVLVVILARQQQTLRARYDDLNERFQSPHAGMFVPTFRAATLDGDSVTIGRTGAGGRQLLLFLTTTCPFCIQSLESWRTLAAACDSLTGVQVYAVSLDSAAETRLYADRHRLRMPVAFVPEAKLTVLYRAHRVPVTMVIDSAGRVRYARRGVFEGREARDSVLAALRS